MQGRLILLLAILVGVYYLLRWFARTPPRQLARYLKQGALYGVIGVLVLLAVTGRLNWVFAAAAAAIPLGQRLFTLLQVLPAVKRVLGGLGIGQADDEDPARSSIRTRFLHMTLDHASGEMRGTVLEGPYEGRGLDDLEMPQLMELLARCRSEDPQSASVLEAWLDRTFGEEWVDHAAGKETPGAAGGPMTREQALEILGLQEGAGKEDIRDAHRRLMQKLHPDRGGSTYLATLLNQAKDRLLG